MTIILIWLYRKDQTCTYFFGFFLFSPSLKALEELLDELSKCPSVHCTLKQNPFINLKVITWPEALSEQTCPTAQVPNQKSLFSKKLFYFRTPQKYFVSMCDPAAFLQSRLRILTSFFHSQDSRSISYLPLGVQKILNRDK